MSNLASHSIRCLAGLATCLLLSATAYAGQDKRLVVALQADGLSLDPHQVNDAASMRMIENLHCGLLRYGQQYGQVELDLASSMTVSSDGLVYEFQLRNDAYFQSGRKIDSLAVKRSIERIKSSQIRSNHFELVEYIETPSPNLLRIKLSQQFSPFPVLLSHPMNAILDVQDKMSWESAGCGPYQLVEWQRDFRLLMRRSPKAYQPQAGLAEIEFRPIPDETSRTTALRTGDVDLVWDLALKDLPKIKTRPELRVQSVAGSFWEYLGLNTRVAPFHIKEVRQAIAWAIDRDLLVRIIKFGEAEALRSGPISSSHWAHLSEAIYPQADLEKARSLLAKAGFADGFQAELLVGSQFPYQVDAAIVIKQQLAAIGIRLRILSLESNLFFHRLGQGEFAMTVVGWLGFVDPDEWFYEIFRSEGAWNQLGYQNRQLDQLIAAGRIESEPQLRRQTYLEIQRLIARDAPMVFLYNNSQIAAHHQNLRGFQVHPTGSSLGLQQAYWQQL